MNNEVNVVENVVKVHSVSATVVSTKTGSS